MVIRPALEEDRSNLTRLLQYADYVHTHLDWRRALDWLGEQPFLILEDNHRLLAALACSPDSFSVAWLRLFATSPAIAPQKAWGFLWPAAKKSLVDLGGNSTCLALTVEPWLEEILTENGFEIIDKVVFLKCRLKNFRPKTEMQPIEIRPMGYEDLTQVAVIDHTAFTSPWAISQSSLEAAYQQAALATVAIGPKDLCGYQISTQMPNGGHLARLAVLPSFQGQGIGYALVQDVLTQFRLRGAENVSVNTQQSNHVSLALYAKSGFELTGEEYMVYRDAA